MKTYLLHFNLYPWRKEKAKQLIQFSFTGMIFILFSIAAGLFLYRIHIDKKINLFQVSLSEQKQILGAQAKENGFLRGDNQLQFKNVQDIQFIQKILTAHHDEIKAFDFIAQTLPPSLYLTQILQEKNEWDLSGISRDEKLPNVWLKILQQENLFHKVQLKTLKKKINSPQLLFDIGTNLYA